MISRDSRCVYVADHQHEVALVLALLREDGIEGNAANSATLGGLEGVTGWVPRAGTKGIEIWVNDLSEADKARTLLAQRMAEVQEVRTARQTRTGTVDVTCPKCEQTSAFPAAEQGTVQSCPKCSAYIDIPDPDDATEWPDDFGTPEEEEGEA